MRIFRFVMVNNPELNPPYPSDPAIPFSGSHTKWSVDQLAINLRIDEAAPTQFHINGVNYEPTQIAGSADFSPFNDFFYTNNVTTWNALWPRDIPLLRAMGGQHDPHLRHVEMGARLRPGGVRRTGWRGDVLEPAEFRRVQG